MESDSSLKCGDTIQGQNDCPKDSTEMGNRTRRNALTPESHNIEPIRQTEIQEKMSDLSMRSSDKSEPKSMSDSQSGS